jgi:hypothetical protein
MVVTSLGIWSVSDIELAQDQVESPVISLTEHFDSVPD